MHGKSSTIILLLLAAPTLAIEFDFEQQPGMPPEAVDGFIRAGELWEELLNDEITIIVPIKWSVNCIPEYPCDLFCLAIRNCHRFVPCPDQR